MNDNIVIKANEYLVREGEESSSLYYVQSGTMGVFKSKSDKEEQIGTIYSGEIVGEMSFIDKEPRSASVKAISDCELVTIPPEKFEKVMNDLPAWYQALIKTMLERLRKANTRIRI